MIKNYTLTAFCLLFAFFSQINAQNVGIGTSTPNSSAKLHIESTNSGLLIPRVSLLAINNGTSPVNTPITGLLVYNTNAAVTAGQGTGFYFWNGTIWEKLGFEGNEWKITGNSGTASGTNFLGTIDNQSLDFRTNNLLRTRITTKGQIEVYNTGSSIFIGQNSGQNDDLNARRNTYIGHESGFTATTATDNIAVGFRALYTNTGNQNVALGSYALTLNTSGTENTGLGTNSLGRNTTGMYNTAVGSTALFNNLTGNYNTAVGRNALGANQTGNENAAVGLNALSSNTSGNGNVAEGAFALRFNTTGSFNTAIGSYSGFQNTIGTRNTSVGNAALQNNIDGGFNTASGFVSLSSNTSGSNNSAFGSYSLSSNTTANDNVAFGYYTLQANTIGPSNTAIGNYAMSTNVAGGKGTAVGYNAMGRMNSSTVAFDNFSVAVGYEALRGSITSANNTGIDNSALGSFTLFLNSTGSQLVAVGKEALYNNTTGSSNIALGYRSLFTNTTGNFNTSVGINSLYFNTTGFNNTAIGREALYNNTTGADNFSGGRFALRSNTIGIYNVALGTSALFGNTTGNYNIALGSSALNATSTGSQNVAVGSSALVSNTTGSFNTAIGTNADVLSANLSNATAIGYNTKVASNNSLVLGNNANVGIGTSSPIYAKLQVVGNSVFTATTAVFGVNTRAAYIRGNDAYSTATTPDYTWYNSDQTGMFHPAASTIAFCANGAGETMRINAVGNVGIRTTTPNGLLELGLDQGRKPGTGTWTIVSDERLKNINGNYSKGLKELMQLQPIRYNYKNVGERTFRNEVLNTEFVGFSAQEVQKVFPEAVGIDADGYLNLNNHAILVAYLNAIKEQQSQIKQQEETIEAQKKELQDMNSRLERLEKMMEKK